MGFRGRDPGGGEFIPGRGSRPLMGDDVFVRSSLNHGGGSPRSRGDLKRLHAGIAELDGDAQVVALVDAH